MGLSKIPITGVNLPVGLVLSSLTGNCFDSGKQQEKFKTYLASLCNKKYSILFNSGISCFYVILEELKKISPKKEVILPAYTASSLVMAVKKAGLKPILCDISLSDFNMDGDLLAQVIAQDTLCIVAVHSFGIINRSAEKTGSKTEDLFIIEDCAQGLGSKWRNNFVGSFGDISLFSFNRGKNLSSYGGGCIVTDSKYLADMIEKGWGRSRGIALGEKIAMAGKMLVLSLVLNPLVYGMLFNIISQLKERKLTEDIKVKKYTDFQASVVYSLFKGIEEMSRRRYNNGMKLINGLKGREDIIVPFISEDSQPAFNRLPVVFNDLKTREKAEKKLWQLGIETSRLYVKPLHHIFDLGYKKSDFPNAVYFAERLLTLPTHPLLTSSDLEKIICAITQS